jgi:hypothetical protein
MCSRSSTKADKEGLIKSGAENGIVDFADARQLISFVTKKAAVFGGMGCRQRGILILIMAGEAGFLRIFFTFYGKETIVNIIMGEGGSRFLRGVKKENEDPGTEDHEYNIDEPLFCSIYFHRR